MKITVKAHPKSRQEKIVKIAENHFEIWVREVPEDGKANAAIIEALSDYLDKPKSSFTLKSGQTSKNKVIEC